MSVTTATDLEDKKLFKEKNDIPGLFDLADIIDFSNMSPEEIESILPEEMITNFINETTNYGNFDILWSENFTFNIMRGKERYKNYVKVQDGLRSFLDRLKGVKVKNSWEETYWLDLFELHCPKANECEASISVEKTNSQEKGVEISLLGFGGGRGKKFSVNESFKIPTKEKCLIISFPFRILIEECHNNFLNSDFIRGSVLDWESGVRQRILTGDDDRCMTKVTNVTNFSNTPQLSHFYKISEFQAPITLEAQKEEEKNYACSFDLSIDLPLINSLALKFKGTKSINKKLSFEYDLKGNKTYKGLRLDNNIGYRWV